MNKERLLKLADIVEKGSHKFNGITAAFDMGTFFDDTYGMDSNSQREFVENYIPKREDIKDPFACNTIACIAGFACLLFDYEKCSNPETRPNLEHKAQELLDLSWKQSQDLFMYYTSSNVTGAEAASVIREFVETGEVNWSPVMDKHIGITE